MKLAANSPLTRKNSMEHVPERVAAHKEEAQQADAFMDSLTRSHQTMERSGSVIEMVPGESDGATTAPVVATHNAVEDLLGLSEYKEGSLVVIGKDQTTF